MKLQSRWWRRWTVLGAMGLLVACSDAGSGGSGGPVGDDVLLPDVQLKDGAAGLDGGADAQKVETTTGDAPLQDADAPADSSDAAAPGTDAFAGPDIDYDLLDPEEDPDAAAPDAVVNPELTTIFAHTSSTLYRLDAKGFSKINTFSFDKYGGSVTDIAIDDKGLLFAITFDDLFQCQTKTAKCTWLASLPQSFNGLTFVPKGTASLAKAALIGIANSGDWNLIEVVAGTATVTKLGSYGGLSSSGDAFSLEGQGTYATTKSFGASSDILVEVNPATGQVIKQIGETGVSDLWGVAWSGGVMYGFAEAGGVYAIDLKTGKATTAPGLFVPSGLKWWGAGVSTRAALQ